MAEEIKNSSEADEEISVEEAIRQLEEINKALEDPRTSLKDSMELYKEGVLLADKIKQSLEGVEKEIKVLSEQE